MYPYPHVPAPASPLESLSAPAQVYVILIIGMVLFMASNTMPALLPDPAKIGQVAPMILQWGFGICLLALLTTMTGLAPGVPQLHITYVHLAVAFLIFFLVWNQVVADIPEEKEKSSSSSSSSASAKKEEKSEQKESKEKDPEPTPWDDLRAHPSAFLTTRLNRYLPWPFPMGRAAAMGPELWWESGQPALLGHYNRPEPEVKDSDEERKKRKEKEAAKEKEKEKEKEKVKAKAKAAAEKEDEQKKKLKEAEEAKKKEMEKMKLKAAEAAEAARLKAIEDRQKQKLWRTKYLAMIIGIGLVNRTLGFLLLLFFSIQLVSQELNAKPILEAPSATTSSSASGPSSSKPEFKSSSSESKSSSSSSDIEKAKRAKLEAMKKAQEEKVREAKKSSSSSSSSAKSESSSSRPKESSSTSRESSSKSSSSKSDVVSSSAIRAAAGSTTVTGIDPDSSFGMPYNLGFGVHYIHTRGEKGDLDVQPTIVASQGIAHPLMSTTYKGWAN